MRRFGLLLLFILTNVCAFAYEFERDGIYYNVFFESSKTVEVTYKDNTYNSYSGMVVIPETVTYNWKEYTVTRIGDNAFKDCVNLENVVLPNTVNQIGAYGFQNCSNLVSIDLSYVRGLSDYAFSGCIKLEEVVFGNVLNSFQDYVFNGCSSLDNVILPDSFSQMGTYAFSNCTGLKMIHMPNTLNEIGKGTFLGCSSLSEIEIPESVRGIGFYAFQASGLEKIKIPHAVSGIGGSAFYNCNHLKEITLEDGSEGLNVNQNVFLNSPVEKVYLGRNFKYTTSSNWYPVFAGLSSLKEVTFGRTVTSLDAELFKDCVSMTNLTVPNNISYISSNCFEGCSITNLILEDGEESLEASFSELSDCLEKVYIGRNSTYSGMFKNCSKLSDVEIGALVLRINGDMFLGCTSLKSLNMPANISEIYSKAFSESSLETFILQDCEEELIISFDCFVDCPLETLHIGRNLDCRSSESLFSSNKETLKHVTFGTNVTEIPYGMFQSCSNIKDITLPQKLETIRRNAFAML